MTEGEPTSVDRPSSVRGSIVESDGSAGVSDVRVELRHVQYDGSDDDQVAGASQHLDDQVETAVPPLAVATTDEDGRFAVRASDLNGLPHDGRLAVTVVDGGAVVTTAEIELGETAIEIRVPSSRRRPRLLTAAAVTAVSALSGCVDWVRDTVETGSTPTPPTTDTPDGTIESQTPPTTSSPTTEQPSTPSSSPSPTPDSPPTTAEPTPNERDGGSSRSSGSSGHSSTPTPTPTPTSTPTPTPTPTSTPTPTPSENPPNAPATLSASGADQQVELTWGSVADVTTYTIYWGTDATVSPTNGTAISDVNSPYVHNGLSNGTTYYYVVTASNAGGESDASNTAQATAAPPAPELDRSIPTTVEDQSSHLYTGSDPIQKDVDPADIDTHRVSTFRGSITTRLGTPLANVGVRVLDHDEFGYTSTRVDGTYRMAVNGGGTVTIRFEKEGYLPIQRTISLVWNQQTTVPDVALIELDGAETTVTMGSSEPQVAQGTPVSDDDGDRTATLLIPANTTALNTDDDTAIESMTLRATEYTVGENGPSAMPGELPAMTGYTYAVELTAEFDGDGGSSGSGGTRPFITLSGVGDVEFDEPIVNYVDNFLNFPVGEAVPTGYYDDEKAGWVASPDGRVIEIIGISADMADLDVDGSGSAADATTLNELNVTDAEREQLATLYAVGDQLWRVPIPHFTPWDHNWPFGPPAGAAAPEVDPSGPDDDPPGGDDDDDPCED